MCLDIYNCLECWENVIIGPHCFSSLQIYCNFSSTTTRISQGFLVIEDSVDNHWIGESNVVCHSRVVCARSISCLLLLLYLSSECATEFDWFGPHYVWS